MSRYVDTEKIFEDQGWAIWAIPGYEGMFDEVYHKCPWQKNWFFKSKGISVYTMDNGDSCPHCGTPIPDSIVGLWKLKNFDLLQAKHQAEAHAIQQAKYLQGNTGGFYLHGTNHPGAKWVGRPGQTWEFYPSQTSSGGAK